MPTTVFSLNTGADSTSIEETYGQIDFASTNFSSSAVMQVSGFGDQQGFLYCDPTAVISAAKVVTGAVLRLQYGTGPGAGNIVVWDSLRAFVVSQLTWDDFSTGNAWQLGGGQGVADRGGSALIDMARGSAGSLVDYSGAGFTAYVAACVAAAVPIRIHIEDSAEYVQYVSSEGADGARPEVEITWTEPPRIIHPARSIVMMR